MSEGADDAEGGRIQGGDEAPEGFSADEFGSVSGLSVGWKPRVGEFRYGEYQGVEMVDGSNGKPFPMYRMVDPQSKQAFTISGAQLVPVFEVVKPGTMLHIGGGPKIKARVGSMNSWIVQTSEKRNPGLRAQIDAAIAAHRDAERLAAAKASRQ
jgi:hypothetical protein